jgi:acyl-CoA carboxylase epsilon subunit
VDNGNAVDKAAVTGEATGKAAAGGATPPLLQIVRGNPTAEETAAVVVVLAAWLARSDAARGAAQGSATLSGWRASSRHLQPLPPHGPGAWRASALPHS